MVDTSQVKNSNVDSSKINMNTAKSDSISTDSLYSAKTITEDSTKVDSTKVKKAKKKKKRIVRKRIVRETSINTIDDLKGRYKSPKKALFLSLILPGAGQAYVGNYIRGTAFFAAEIGLITSLYMFSVKKHDDEVKKYKKHADKNWSRKKI